MWPRVGSCGRGGGDTIRRQTPPPRPLDQALGFPTTWVWSTTPEGLLDALEAGHTVVSDPQPHSTLWTPQIAVGPGVHPGPVTVRVTASVAHPGLRVEVLGLQDGDCVVDTRTDNEAVPLVEPEVLFSRSLAAGEAFDHEMTLAAPAHHCSGVARRGTRRGGEWCGRGVAHHVAVSLRMRFGMSPLSSRSGMLCTRRSMGRDAEGHGETTDMHPPSHSIFALATDDEAVAP